MFYDISALKGRALLHPYGLSATTRPHSHCKDRKKNVLMCGSPPWIVQGSLYAECSSAIPTAGSIGMGIGACWKNQPLPKMCIPSKPGCSPGCSAVLVKYASGSWAKISVFLLDTATGISPSPYTTDYGPSQNPAGFWLFEERELWQQQLKAFPALTWQVLLHLSLSLSSECGRS